MDPFYNTMGKLISMPWLAAAPALLFFALYYWSHKRIVLVTAIAWMGYMAYELTIKFHIMRCGDCDIRVDLLLIYPILVGLSLMAAVTAVWKLRRLITWPRK